MAGRGDQTRWLAAGFTALTLALGAVQNAHADASLLNVSYDVTRELYKDINTAFVSAYKQKSGETVAIRQSHGASSAQALSVLQGLQADVVTMNQPNDIDLLAERGHLVPENWRARLPNNSAPYTTTMVFLVRKGNPKHIRDWDDLAKPGVQVGFRIRRRRATVATRTLPHGATRSRTARRTRRRSSSRSRFSATYPCSTRAAVARRRPSRSAASATCW